MTKKTVSNFLAKNWLMLIVIAVGAALRWVNLAESMTFFYDQGRDALAVTKILSGHLTLIGPTSDMPGLFFGPLWFYLLAVLYKISFGNPVTVLWLVSFLDLLTIPLLGLVGQLFFNRRVGLLAATFWAVGALPVAYARTLANPATGGLWAILVVLGLFFVNRGRQNYLLLVAFSLAVLFQLNAAAAFFFFFFVALECILLRKNFSARIFFLALAVFSLSFFPQALFDIRHGFLGLNSVLKIFTASGAKEGFTFGLVARWDSLVREISDYTFFGQPKLAIISIVLGLFFLRKKLRDSRLFVLWIGVPIFVFLLLYHRFESHPYYLQSVVPAAILLLAVVIDKVSRRSLVAAVVITIAVLYFNSSGLAREIFQKDHLAQPADPNLIGFADQQRVLDYIYTRQSGNKFGYFAYNVIPYWADETWQYLFSWYGQKRYGFVPSRNSGSNIYLIYEPEPFLGQAFQDAWLNKFRRSKDWQIVSNTRVGVYFVEQYVQKQN